MKFSGIGLLALGYVLLGLTPASAAAAGGQTHGGTAIVCRNPNGSIATAEVLDVFEARELYGIDLIAVTDVRAARESLLADLAKRLDGKSYYPKFLSDTIGALHGRFKKLAPNVRIELIPDVFPKISQKGCAIEQLASFQDGGDILLDSEIFDALTPLNRFALELHESVYYLDRKWRGAADSGFSRKIVGLLLAKTWSTGLDATLANYHFDYPAAGRYTYYGQCDIRIQLLGEGALRMSSGGGAACNAIFDPAPFLPKGYLDFVPDGTRGEWQWRSPKDQNGSYSTITVRLVTAGQIQIGDGVFQRVGALR